MKILFVTSEHPQRLFGGMGTFVREFLGHLKLVPGVQVRSLYVHYEDTAPPAADGPYGSSGDGAGAGLIDHVLVPELLFPAQGTEGRLLELAASIQAQARTILEDFQPDIIHCNDRLTFLPFRFEPRVVYSSHLLMADLLGTKGLDDDYFQELKVERCGLERSALVLVYSRFARRRVNHALTDHCQPLVLPLGFHPEQYHSQKPTDRFHIAYFGRFENEQKGLLRFIRAVEALGREWQETKGVSFSLYGRGDVSNRIDLSLFEQVGFLEGDELRQAYARTHIVVMPSTYEPFGLVALEAMAASCLLLLNPGLGMDEFARPGVNCLAIAQKPRELAAQLQDLVDNWCRYRPLAEGARNSIEHWTWKRSVGAHYQVYKALLENRSENLLCSQRPEYQELALRIPDQAQALPELPELLRHLEASLEATQQSPRETDVPRLLIHGGNTRLLDSRYPAVKEISLWHDLENSGLLPKLEFLPVDSGSFEEVIVLGVWETQVDPHLVLEELLRCTRKTLRIYYTLEHKAWHTLNMESVEEWGALAEKHGVEILENQELEIENWYAVLLQKK